MKKSKLLSLLMALTLAVSIGLTGCTPQEDASGDDLSSPTDDSVNEELTTVTLQLKWLPSVQFMGFYVAKDLGYYEEEGIEIEILSGGPDIVAANQVSIGAADVGVHNLYSLLPFEEQEQPVTMIGQVFQSGSLILVSKAESGIETPEDLVGKTVGGWLGVADYPIYALLDKYEINKDTDLTLANQGTTMDSFLSGELDVASATVYNEYLLLLSSGLSEDELNIIDFDEEDCGMLEDTIIANTEWLAKNPELAEGFLRATMKGWSYATANSQEAAEIVWNYLDQASTNIEHQTASAEKVASLVAPNGTELEKMCAINDDIVNSTATIAQKYGIIEEIPENIYDSSVIEAVLASLE